MNTKKPRQQFLIYPQRPDLIDDLKDIAKQHNRSVNGEINFALEKYLDKLKQSHNEME